MLTSEARIDAQTLRKGRLRDDDFPRLARAAGILSHAPVFIDDTPGITLMDMRSKSRRLKADHGLDLIIVDYLQLMTVPNGAENRQQEVSQISRGLKALAKELSVPVIALSQLSRAPEQRAGDSKRPQLSDLRESGAIEQDADLIMFIYRPEVYEGPVDKDGNSLEGRAEIIEISRGLKALAKELSVPVIALSQLSRAPEQRAGDSKRPQLSDLRESGAIEQDADLIMFIYRPEVYEGPVDKDGNSLEGRAEII